MTYDVVEVNKVPPLGLSRINFTLNCMVIVAWNCGHRNEGVGLCGCGYMEGWAATSYYFCSLRLFILVANHS